MVVKSISFPTYLEDITDIDNECHQMKLEILQFGVAEETLLFSLIDNG